MKFILKAIFEEIGNFEYWLCGIKNGWIFYNWFLALYINYKFIKSIILYEIGSFSFLINWRGDFISFNFYRQCLDKPNILVNTINAQRLSNVFEQL